MPLELKNYINPLLGTFIQPPHRVVTEPIISMKDLLNSMLSAEDSIRHGMNLSSAAYEIQVRGLKADFLSIRSVVSF